MTPTICLAANTLYYPQGGGHRWAYLNWALGLRAAGCRVIWLEGFDPKRSPEHLQELVATLKDQLAPFGLADAVALWPWSGDPLLAPPVEGVSSPEAALDESDLLINQYYAMTATLTRRFRRTALLDIDPGLTQLWMSRGDMRVAPHDLYFTIGETVGRAGARFPDLGLTWHYTPPCVCLDAWPVSRAPEGAPFTTVTHWSMEDQWEEEEDGEPYPNAKRDGFAPFLALPHRTAQPLELALVLSDWEQDERVRLEGHGWRVRDSYSVTATPADYRRYIQGSRGEFSCAKPSCIRLQNAWISDRTLCYLASGKPAVVQHTGPSRFLPDAAGLFRFHTMDEAVRHLETVAADYDGQCALARSLAEERFDARTVTASVVERALS